jgi:hypothetical protein
MMNVDNNGSYFTKQIWTLPINLSYILLPTSGCVAQGNSTENGPL